MIVGVLNLIQCTGKLDVGKMKGGRGGEGEGGRGGEGEGGGRRGGWEGGRGRGREGGSMERQTGQKSDKKPTTIPLHTGQMHVNHRSAARLLTF